MNVYLNFDGNCRAAIEFYCEVFGAEVEVLQTFGDAPGDMPVAPEHSDRVMHCTLRIGEGQLMASDRFPGREDDHVVGNNFAINVPVVDREAAEALFPKLATGGEVQMPLAETFWGSLFGICRDRFGVDWMVNVDLRSTS